MANRRFSAAYVDALLDRPEWKELADLAGILTSAAEFDAKIASYGLVEPLFALVETLSWEATSWRSGVWAYYEATADHTQQSLLQVLRRIAPKDLAEAYGQGIFLWRSEGRAAIVDAWIKANEDRIRDWLVSLANANRTDIHAVA